jgi:hypothetical protein
VAHPLFHFGIGLAVGTAAILPSIAGKIRSGDRMAPWLGKRLITAYALGVFAVVPGLLHLAGLPGFICNGWWMNVFIFYHLMNKLKPGGMLGGEVLAVSCFALQYVLLLAALRTRLKPRV